MAIRKIAITTWWHYHNYGSALQVTAAYNALKHLGYRPDVVNYIPSGKKYSTNPTADREHEDNWERYQRVTDEGRVEKFDEFLKNQLTFTQKAQDDGSFAELDDKYDVFVTGSDQIWAPRVFDERYFLNFVQDNRKKIAYAPSIGLPAIENQYVKYKMQELISQFAHISVREEQGKRLISEELGIDRVQVMPDPTLLLSYDEWRAIIPKSKSVKAEKYILCYFLGESEGAWQHVNRIAEQTGYTTKIIPIFNKDMKHGEPVFGVGPKEFLDLVDGAEIVLTDSFHCAIFSIIFQKPFYVFERFKRDGSGSQNSRIYNLLNMVKLEDRLVKYADSVEKYDFIINFAKTHKILEKEKTKALTYLKNAIETVKNDFDAEENDMIDITKEFSVRSGVLSVIDTNIKTKLDRFGQYAYFVDKKYKIPADTQRKLDFVDSMYSLGESEEKISNELFGGIKRQHDILGYYTGLHIGHVRSSELRKNSSSGGIVTYILTKLLEEQKVDFVICPAESKSSDDTLYKYTIQKTVDGVRGSAKTKYYPMELSEVLNYVKLHKGRYAVVGITGYIYEIRLLQKIDQIFKKRIKYTIGLITCHQKTTKYTEQIAWQHGVNPDSLQKFQYRVKNDQLRPDVYLTEFSGDKDGKTVTIQAAATENYGTDWAHGFFKVPFSDFTDDVFNKTADISLGDAWEERWVQDKSGNNVLVCRNKDIQEIIDNGVELGELEVIEVSEDEVLNTQKGNIHHMIDDLPYRIENYGNKDLRICNEEKYLHRQIPLERQLVQKIRHDITFKSHSLYISALRINDYNFFIDHTKHLVEKYQLIYKLIPRINSLGIEVNNLHAENIQLKSHVSSLLSTKRSLRLFLGNVKRHYSRGPLGTLKRAVRPRTRLKRVWQQSTYLLNSIYWIPKNLVINYKVNKIVKTKLDKDHKIPKVIHYIWVGGADKPESVDKYIKTWKKYCHDYEIIEWNEKNYNIKKNRYAREAYQAKKWAFVTDFIRLDLLDRYGGIYMDSDVEAIKSLDRFLKEPAFSSFEAGDPSQIFLPTGMMASEKDGAWVKYLKSYYSPERSFFKDNGVIDDTPNTTTITRMTVDKYDIKLNNKLQKFDDFTMYPSDYFCPKSWSTRKITLTKNTHAIHHFAASWLPTEVRDLQHKGEE